MLTEPKWCWLFDGDEHSQGPFDSREEAIEDAQVHVDDDAPANPDEPYARDVVLGHVVPVQPENYVDCLDLDWLLDTMNEHDELGAWDEPAIEHKCDCPDPEKLEGPLLTNHIKGHTCGRRAEKALHEALRGWAREWLVCDSFTVKEVETIELTATQEPELGPEGRPLGWSEQDAKDWAAEDRWPEGPGPDAHGCTGNPCTICGLGSK